MCVGVCVCARASVWPCPHCSPGASNTNCPLCFLRRCLTPSVFWHCTCRRISIRVSYASKIRGSMQPVDTLINFFTCRTSQSVLLPIYFYAPTYKWGWSGDKFFALYKYSMEKLSGRWWNRHLSGRAPSGTRQNPVFVSALVYLTILERTRLPGCEEKKKKNGLLEDLWNCCMVSAVNRLFVKVCHLTGASCQFYIGTEGSLAFTQPFPGFNACSVRRCWLNSCKSSLKNIAGQLTGLQ